MTKENEPKSPNRPRFEPVEMIVDAVKKFLGAIRDTLQVRQSTK